MSQSSVVRRSRRVDANYVRPGRRPVCFYRPWLASQFSQSRVTRCDPAEQHEHARDDVRRWRDAQWRGLLLQLLVDERFDIFGSQYMAKVAVNFLICS